MRGRVWAAVAGLVLALAPPPPAYAATAGVSLVAGVVSGADVAATLRRHHVTVVHSVPLTGAVSVEVPADQAATALSALRADPAVTYVETDRVAHADLAPDDPDYGDQWGIRQTGADTVWDSTQGSSSVTVAVVDSGVRPIFDLAGRVLPGWDFVNGDNDPNDDFGHGTQAADVIAGAGDNGRGIAGLCWTCRILPVKVLGPDGDGTYSTIAEGIRYAADRGAQIINLSLGGAADSRILRDAVAYAVSKGALVVGAAGNNGSAAPHYPAAIPSVLAIGASTAGDARYPYSNYGAGWVDLAAPGCNPAGQPSGIVTRFCGTSSSAPFVAGVAALLASTTPRPSATELRNLLTSTAHPLAGNWVAAGRVDAAAALAAASTHPSPVATSFAVVPAGLGSGVLTIRTRTAATAGVTLVELYAGDVLVGSDTTPGCAFRWNSAPRTGPVTLTLRAYDRGGNVATASTVVRLDNTPPSVRFHQRGATQVDAVAADVSGISRLDLIVNGRVAQRYAGSTHRFALPIRTYGRRVSVQVRAYDRAGNTAVSRPRTWYR